MRIVEPPSPAREHLVRPCGVAELTFDASSTSVCEGGEITQVQGRNVPLRPRGASPGRAGSGSGGAERHLDPARDLVRGEPTQQAITTASRWASGSSAHGWLAHVGTPPAALGAGVGALLLGRLQGHRELEAIGRPARRLALAPQVERVERPPSAGSAAEPPRWKSKDRGRWSIRMNMSCMNNVLVLDPVADDR